MNMFHNNDSPTSSVTMKPKNGYGANFVVTGDTEFVALKTFHATNDDRGVITTKIGFWYSIHYLPLYTCRLLKSLPRLRHANHIHSLKHGTPCWIFIYNCGIFIITRSTKFEVFVDEIFRLHHWKTSLVGCGVRWRVGGVWDVRSKTSPWWRHQMQTISALLALVRGIHRWIPFTKASATELWCFLWSALEQTVEQTIETPVIWDAIALIMTAL